MSKKVGHVVYDLCIPKAVSEKQRQTTMQKERKYHINYQERIKPADTGRYYMLYHAYAHGTSWQDKGLTACDREDESFDTLDFCLSQLRPKPGKPSCSVTITLHSEEVLIRGKPFLRQLLRRLALESTHEGRYLGIEAVVRPPHTLTLYVLLTTRASRREGGQDAAKEFHRVIRPLMDMLGEEAAGLKRFETRQKAHPREKKQ